MLKYQHQMKLKYGNIPDNNLYKNVLEYFDKSKKLIKCNLGIEFIRKCLDNQINPDFSRINLAPSQLNLNNRFKNNIRLEITHEELKTKYKMRNSLIKDLDVLRNNLFVLDDEDRLKLEALFEEKKEILTSEIELIHTKKLEKLGVIEPIKIKSQHVTQRKKNKNKNNERRRFTTIRNAN
jgi:hypothetical protein